MRITGEIENKKKIKEKTLSHRYLLEKKGNRELIVLEKHSIIGCILSDQVKNLDYRQINCDFIEKAAEEEIDSVVENIKLLIE